MFLVLAAFYLLNFATVGAFFPWFPPLLAERGFTPGMIGASLAAGSLSRMFLTPVWGYAADRWHRRREIVVMAALLSGVSLLAVAGDWSREATLALIFLYGFFTVPIFPLAEAFTFGYLGDRRDRYGHVRLWGSLGFIVTSQGLGLLVQTWGLALVPWVAGAPMVLAALLATKLPGGPPPAPPVPVEPAPPRAARMPWRPLAAIWAAAALGQGAHGPFYDFFSIQLGERGVAPWLIGLLWSLGVIAEVALMALSPLLLTRIKLLAALRLALVVGAARWVLFAVAPPLPLIFVGQTLHAFSFALLHIASVSLTDRLTPAGRKAFGQTWLSTCAYGIGIGTGLFVAGQFRSAAGDAGLYGAAAVACLLGLLATAGVGRQRFWAGANPS